MNIYRYYQYAAKLALNTSLVAFVPPIFFIIYTIIYPVPFYFFLYLLPFIIYSLFSFHQYLANMIALTIVNENKINQMQPTSLFSENDLLVTFLPAPSLRMLFFSPSGQQVGEIRDIQFKEIKWMYPSFLDIFFHKTYGLFDHKQTLIGHIQLKRNEIKILSLEGKVVQVIKEVKWSRYDAQNINLTIRKKSMITDFEFENQEGRLIAELKKGWMPLEWGKRFINANTPVLTFQPKVKREERFILFAILAKKFENQEN